MALVVKIELLTTAFAHSFYYLFYYLNFTKVCTECIPALVSETSCRVTGQSGQVSANKVR